LFKDACERWPEDSNKHASTIIGVYAKARTLPAKRIVLDLEKALTHFIELCGTGERE